MANLQHIKHPAIKRKRNQEPNKADVMINNKKKKIKPTTRYEKQELAVKAANQYVEEEDRLTNLPEPLKVHILSLLRLKYAARTSALSKSWVSLWTLIPNLDIDPSVTYNLRDYDKIVTKILDCRDKSVKLDKLTFHDDHVSSGANIWKTVFGYALSNGVKELIASISSFDNAVAWPDCLHDHTGSDSLTRLKLMSDSKISWRFLGQRLFKKLTNLYLRRAIITNNPDSFSGLPALEKLTLCHCCYEDSYSLNVRASQLSALTIKCSYSHRLDRCELSTPNLRIFKFRTPFGTFPVFITRPPTQALPVLDEFVFHHQGSLYQKQSFHQVISIFGTFHNAKSLTISESIVELLSMFPMELMMMIGCSPFRGLKFLKSDGEIPSEVQDYLLQQSADAKISVVKIKHG